MIGETSGRDEPAVRWDLTRARREGGRLSADGEVIQENGAFVAGLA